MLTREFTLRCYLCIPWVALKANCYARRWRNDGYFINALSCMPRKTRTWEATEKCPKCPRSNAVETPNDDSGRSQDTSDTRGRGRGYGPPALSKPALNRQSTPATREEAPADACVAFGRKTSQTSWPHRDYQQLNSSSISASRSVPLTRILREHGRATRLLPLSQLFGNARRARRHTQPCNTTR